MQVRAIRQLFSLRDVRNAFLGAVVLVGGLGLALLTYIAHLTKQTELAGIAAGVSLIFVILILIFIVPPLARNAGREAAQLNLPFELTTGGAIMLILIAIVAVSAWNTANNLLFLVLSFMVAAMIAGFIAGGICLKKLEVKMRFPETIFAGEDTTILVTLSNKKNLFSSYSVVADVRGHEHDESSAAADLRMLLPASIARRLSKPPTVRRTLDYFVHVPRNRDVETRTTHVFTKRGRFLIKDFELSTKFPFGFFRHRRRLPARETELIVLPALASLDHHLDDVPLETGSVVTNKRGTGQDLLALRDYQPNDDLRRVDWKATARTRNLIVREFSAEDDKRVTIFVDTGVPADTGKRLTLREKIEAEQAGKDPSYSERFERGLSIAASLMSFFTEEQADIRLIVDDQKGDFGIGSRHLHELLKRLAVAEPRFTGDEMTEGEITALSGAFEESTESHNFLLTSRQTGLIPPEILEKSKLIRL